MGNMVNMIVLVINVISAFAVIALVLLHAGKGGGLSDMFGGSSQSLSGGTALERRLDKITVVFAVLFFVSAFYLALNWGG